MYFPVELRSNIAAIIGGGPSLEGVDLSRIPGHWSKIAVNNAYKIAPDADCLFFADARWYEQHAPSIRRDWAGRMVSVAGDHHKVPPSEVYKLGREFQAPIGEKVGTYNERNYRTWKLAGRDSGTMAVNLAYHMGATEIVLFGLDMGYNGARSHWHSGHMWPTTSDRYRLTFAPVLECLIAELATRGVRVWRATEPGPSFVPRLMHYATSNKAPDAE